jgi:hypothetical protein
LPIPAKNAAKQAGRKLEGDWSLFNFLLCFTLHALSGPHLLLSFWPRALTPKKKKKKKALPIPGI